MADNIVGSLFGVSPEQLTQNRVAQDYAANLKAVQLTPMQQGNLMLRQGASQLGNVGLGLLGVEDPEMQKVSAIKQLSSQFDLSSPTGMREFARALQSIAPNEAMLAAKRADEMTQAVALQTKTYAEAQKALKDKIPAAEEESKRIRLDELIAQLGPQAGARAFQQEQLEGKKSVAKAGAPGGGPDTTVKAFELADPEALKEYRTQARSASGQLAMISQARENLPTAVTGQGLPTIVRGLNAQLAPLGINTETVASTRNLEQALKSIISQGIKQYGANPSTVDLQFAVQAAADIKDPLQAITATLNYLETRARNTVDKADAAEQYLLGKKNLAGFEKEWTTKVTKPTAKGKSRTLPSGAVVIEED